MSRSKRKAHDAAPAARAALAEEPAAKRTRAQLSSSSSAKSSKDSEESSAKRKFKVYPSAYAYAYGVKDGEEPATTKRARRSPAAPKPAKRGRPPRAKAAKSSEDLDERKKESSENPEANPRKDAAEANDKSDNVDSQPKPIEFKNGYLWVHNYEECDDHAGGQIIYWGTTPGMPFYNFGWTSHDIVEEPLRRQLEWYGDGTAIPSRRWQTHNVWQYELYTENFDIYTTENLTLSQKRSLGC